MYNSKNFMFIYIYITSDVKKWEFIPEVQEALFEILNYENNTEKGRFLAAHTSYLHLA